MGGAEFFFHSGPSIFFIFTVRKQREGNRNGFKLIITYRMVHYVAWTMSGCGGLREPNLQCQSVIAYQLY